MLFFNNAGPVNWAIRGQYTYLSCSFSRPNALSMLSSELPLSLEL